MTWEISSIVCTLIVCLTICFCFVGWVQEKQWETGEAISPDEFEQMKTAVGQIKTEHEAVKKLAEEAKEKLSGLNLAGAFGRRPNA